MNKIIILGLAVSMSFMSCEIPEVKKVELPKPEKTLIIGNDTVYFGKRLPTFQTIPSDKSAPWVFSDCGGSDFTEFYLHPKNCNMSYCAAVGVAAAMDSVFVAYHVDFQLGDSTFDYILANAIFNEKKLPLECNDYLTIVEGIAFKCRHIPERKTLRVFCFDIKYYDVFACVDNLEQKGR